MYVHRQLKTLVAFRMVNLWGFPRRRVGEELGHQDPPGAIGEDSQVMSTWFVQVITGTPIIGWSIMGFNGILWWFYGI
jgi:hypothetical protein